MPRGIPRVQCHTATLHSRTFREIADAQVALHTHAPETIAPGDADSADPTG